MVRIDIEYKGDLRCQAEHEPSRQLLVTDAPKDNMGRGEAFSPTDLLATSLGTCVVTTMAIVARREGLELSGFCSSVEKVMVADPLRRVGELKVKLTMPAGLSDVQRKKLEAAAHACPVHKSLHPDTKVEFTFLYPA